MSNVEQQNIDTPDDLAQTKTGEFKWDYERKIEELERQIALAELAIRTRRSDEVFARAIKAEAQLAEATERADRLGDDLRAALKELRRFEAAREENTRRGGRVNELDYLIFANDSKEPIAGFAFKDDAVAWVLGKRWSRHWYVTIQKAGEELCVLRADAQGRIGEDESGAEGGRQPCIKLT